MARTRPVSNMTKRELLVEARKLNIAGRSSMNTETLRSRVASARGDMYASQTRTTKRDDALTGTTQGIAAIRKAREAAVVDDFKLGTVITWESDAGYNVFLYACIKTPVGWATTSKAGNMFVGQVLSFEELLEVLGRAETKDVMMASAWTPLA